MPDFYVTLKAITNNLNVFEGNDVVHTLTALPKVEDFNAAKARYCALLLHQNRVVVTSEQVILTMCVPIF